MEQEQVMDKGARVTLETGKQLFQFLAYALSQGPHTKDHITFEEAEVNFDKLKKEFKKSGVNFHFADNKDGTKTVWFEAINQKIIQEAIRKTIKEIVTDPKAATEKYMKKPYELTPKQQIEKIKGTAKKSTEAVKNKKKGKSI